MRDRSDHTEATLATRLHRDESGAVVLLCVAGCIILFMMALIIWDAGKGVRSKLDVQAAADTAARSQASVKARAMNLIAFGNVAKRSITGLHSMYIGMWSAYTTWWERRCDLCKDQTFTDLAACRDCTRNLQLSRREGMGDWEEFSDEQYPYVSVQDALQDTPFPWGRGDVQRAYRTEMMAVDDYQAYIDSITPWWAWSEMLVRGTRNGASLTVSFPAPEIPSTSSSSGSLANPIEDAIGSGSGGSLGVSDELPVDKIPFTSDRSGCWESYTARGEAERKEFRANLATHRRRSREGAFMQSNIETGRDLARLEGCFFSQQLFGDHMDPYVLANPGGRSLEEAVDLMARSNIVFGYSFHPERGVEVDSSGGGGVARIKHGQNAGKDASRLGILDGVDYGVRAGNNSVFDSSGDWAIARAEVTFPGPSGTPASGFVNPPTGGQPDGRREMIWLWRAGWTAKLRPLALPGEFDRLTYTLNDAYRETGPYIGLADEIGVTDQGKMDGYSLNAPELASDFRAMHRYTRSLDGNTIDGFPR